MAIDFDVLLEQISDSVHDPQPVQALQALLASPGVKNSLQHQQLTPSPTHWSVRALEEAARAVIDGLAEDDRLAWERRQAWEYQGLYWWEQPERGAPAPLVAGILAELEQRLEPWVQVVDALMEGGADCIAKDSNEVVPVFIDEWPLQAWQLQLQCCMLAHAAQQLRAAPVLQQYESRQLQEALFSAAFNAQPEAFAALVALGQATMPHDLQWHLSDCDMVSAVARSSSAAMMARLLDSAATEAYTIDRALFKAALQGHAAVIRVILEHKSCRLTLGAVLEAICAAIDVGSLDALGVLLTDGGYTLAPVHLAGADAPGAELTNW
eukprot:scaffold1.g5568.t1